jgi:hypothetical protein
VDHSVYAVHTQAFVASQTLNGSEVSKLCFLGILHCIYFLCLYSVALRGGIVEADDSTYSLWSTESSHLCSIDLLFLRREMQGHR